ncbi:hypothetical protein [Myxococcus landrumensis]|uniref:Uncharacterized protein n=1 Tax=Myxococcus landrumensis TaxID=2813577 RepID=A0ABX7NA88_9BACT|nr:hypothetical protein [Myxococcus landrumus]QSQ14449.1 hypothetical protein JY572_40180 [Myxococcus landrumus]
MSTSLGPMVGDLLFLWLPLLVGFFTGRWVLKRVTARSDTLAQLASSSFAVPSALVGALMSAGLMMATNAVNAPRTIAWLQLNDVLPFPPTPGLLRIVSWVAAFFVGYNVSGLFRGSATQPTTASFSGLESPPPPRGNKYSSTMVRAFWFATIPVGLSLGAAAIGMKKGGFLRTSDVGHLAELAAIQEQLRPLESCEVLYRQVDGKGRRKYPDSVVVRDCSGNSSQVIYIPVPSWASQDVSFEMGRGSASAEWSIIVDKDEVPFPALKEALEQFAPIIVAQYPGKLQELRQRQEESQRWREEQQRAKEQKTKESAKSTYPE